MVEASGGGDPTTANQFIVAGVSLLWALNT